MKFDPGLSPGERQLLVNDVYALMRNRIKPKPNSSFARVFGGLGAPDVVRYLDDRINYLISPRTPVNESLRWTDTSISDLSHYLIEGSAPTRQDELPNQDKMGTRDSEDDDSVQTVAENIGITLWILQESSRPSRVAFQIGDARVPLLSPRVGIVRIGGAYPSFDPSVRMATLVHEARHSDCTGGLTREALQRYRDGRGLGPQACGHLHARCPEGHEYEGELACDALPWGAYSIEAVYASAMEQNCSNCSRKQKQLARVLKLDAASRVLVFDQMIRGELGPPDMSSVGSVLQDVRDSLKGFRELREERVK